MCKTQGVNLNHDYKKLYVKLLKCVAEDLLIIPGKCIYIPINSNDFELDIFPAWSLILECFLYLATNRKYLNIKMYWQKKPLCFFDLVLTLSLSLSFSLFPLSHFLCIYIPICNIHIHILCHIQDEITEWEMRALEFCIKLHSHKVMCRRIKVWGKRKHKTHL